MTTKLNHKDHPCAVCDRLGKKLCCRCNGIRYCSKRCQNLDWKSHKLLCLAFKDFSQEKRPNHDYYRAIYFPAGRNRPHFAWVKRYRQGDIEIICREPEHTNDETDRAAIEPTAVIRQNSFTKHHLKKPIILAFREQARTVDPSLYCMDNKSIGAIDDELVGLIQGPIVAYGSNGKTPSHTMTDLNPTSFCHIVHYLREMYDGSLRNGLIRRTDHEGCDLGACVHEGAESVPAVRLSCIGDSKIYVSEPLQNTRAARTLCTQPSDFMLPIAECVGMASLMVRQLPPALLWRDRSNRVSPDAVAECAENPMFWALAEGWTRDDDHFGSVLIVRKDGGPLDYNHLLALYKYCVLEFVNDSGNTKQRIRRLDGKGDGVVISGFLRRYLAEGEP